jgi:uncharacterized ion transporter superfamily protein YfcC
MTNIKKNKSYKRRRLLKNLKFPAAQTILLIIAFFVAVLTWIIPAGKYDTLSYHKTTSEFIISSVNDVKRLPATPETLELLNVKIPLKSFTTGAIYKPISIPDTYKPITAKPQGVFEFFQSPIKGIIETADIIFLVLIIGGLIHAVEKTGAFSAGIYRLSRLLQGREHLLIIATTTLVALGGTTFGFAEEGIAFLPILIPVFLAAKYDALTAFACVYLGSGVGGLCSTTNPFSTIIASDAAGIIWTQGLEGRVLMLIICLSITILFILRYAKRVKADPKQSLIYSQKEDIEKIFSANHSGVSSKLSTRLLSILFVFMLCFVVMIFGVIVFNWWFIEMTAVFFFGAIVIGFIGKLSEANFISTFVKGAGSLLGVAFIIGLARGISIIMSDGLISDTILFNAARFTEDMDKGFFINALFLVYNFMAFFVPSSSGTAVLTMPVIAPLAETVSIGREVIVNAYQFGNGLFNLINPTGLILAFLGVAKIGYDKFLKFVWPLVVTLAIVIIFFLTLSVL